MILYLSIAIIALLLIFIAYQVGIFIQKQRQEDNLKQVRQDAISRSRATLAGQFSEQLAPYLPNFPHSPTECSFLGKPIDIIVFKGADQKNIEEVVFVEIKSGNSRLSQHQKTLKQAIQNKNVSWHEYRVPENLTKRN